MIYIYISIYSCKDNDGCQPEFVSNILGESSGDISQFTTQFGAKVLEFMWIYIYIWKCIGAKLQYNTEI